MKTHFLLLINVKLASTFSMKKQYKLQKCDMGHELALKLSLVSIKVLNCPKTIKYILSFKAA